MTLCRCSTGADPTADPTTLGSATKIREKGREDSGSVAPPQQDGTLTDRTWGLLRQDEGLGTFIAWPVVEVLRQALNP